MRIHHHIFIEDYPSVCLRQDYRFSPPVRVESLLGKIRSFYGESEGNHPKREASGSHCEPVINRNEILDFQESVTKGTLVSIAVRSGFRLAEICMDQMHALQIIADTVRLQYWFTAGQDGVFQVTGKMVKDSEGWHAKLLADLIDIPFRSYIVQRSLADSRVALAEINKLPEVMSTREAAKYLAVSTSKLYKKAEAGLIFRTPDKKFRKVDLDTYLASGGKRKR